MEILFKTRRAWPLQPWAWIKASQNYLCYRFLFFTLHYCFLFFLFLFSLWVLRFLISINFIHILLYAGVNTTLEIKIYDWKGLEKSSGNMNGMELVEWKECTLCCGVLRRMHELKVKWSGGSKWGTNKITERKCSLKRNASTTSTLINKHFMFLWPATTNGWWGNPVVWIGGTPGNSPKV